MVYLPVYITLYSCSVHPILIIYIFPPQKKIRSHSFSVRGYKRLARLQNCEKVMGLCTALYKMLLFCA